MLDRAMTALPDNIAEALRHYYDNGDRSPPSVFVGRADMLEGLRRTVATAARGAVGLTTVVYGVPGAGKTSLCNEFVKTCGIKGDSDARIVPVYLEAAAFSQSGLSLALEIVEQVPVLDRLLAEHPERKRLTTMAINAAGTAVSWIKGKSKLDLALNAMDIRPDSSFGTVIDAFAAHMWGESTTLVATLDETQNLKEDANTRDNLQAIHLKGFKTNFVLLTFGLHNALERLNRLGVSRIARGQKRHLSMLAPDEAERVVDATLDSLGLADGPEWSAFLESEGLTNDDWNKWRAAAKAVVLEESAGFPQHLTNGIRGISRIVLEGNMLREDPASALRDEFTDIKDEYYAARLANWRRHTLALGAALKWARGKPVPMSLLRTALETADNSGRALAGNDAGRVMDDLVDNGILIERQSGDLEVEIPSMAGYLASLFDDAMAHGNPVARQITDTMPVPSGAGKQPS